MFGADGYGGHRPAFGCAWEGCAFASDDAVEVEKHQEEHDAREGYDPCPRCGGDHDRIDRREPCEPTRGGVPARW